MNLITFQGRRRDERPFSALYFASGGYGALSGMDGWATLPHPSNMAVVPVEVWETLTHMTVLDKKLTPDSGGAGEWRGGLGQTVRLRNDTGSTLVMLGMGNRTEFPARGQFGGGSGSLRIHKVDGQVVHAKGRIEVEPGAVISVTEAGGAGFGNPKKRDRTAVAADVADGYVSTKAAQADYA